MNINQIDAIAPNPVTEIYLGEFDGCNIVARVVEGEAPEIDATGEKEHLSYANLRLIGSMLPADEASLLAYARALGQWHLSHRFCSRCGQRLLIREAGHVQICSDSTCALQLFPRRRSSRRRARSQGRPPAHEKCRRFRRRCRR